MSHSVKIIRGAVSFLLLVVCISFGISPAANAAGLPDGSYECSSGIKDGGAPTFTIANDVVTDGRSCTGVVVIPLGVTGIGPSAFYAGPSSPLSITNVTIPNSVTSIGTSAFRNAPLLTSLTLGNSVATIGDNAFRGATSLTSLSIPSSVTTIDDFAFDAATSLRTLTFGDTLVGMGTTINDFAFNGATALTSLTIGNSVTTINVFAFSGATALTSLTIGNSVTTISYFAFNLATALTSLTIGNAVTTIRGFAFNGATALTSLTIGNSVSSIGVDEFLNTPALTQYTYCGTALTEGQLVSAGLTGKTKLCAPVFVPPMLPSFAPSITVNNGTITCTIGVHSRAATSVVFSLFVDGNHVATNFSSTGDHLPSWLAPWAAASTIQRSATLQSASWNIDIAGDASRASCWTLAYSNNATGLISSDQISLR